MSEQILIVENDKDQGDWFKQKLEEKFENIKVFGCNGQKEVMELLKGNDIKEEIC
jgi:hypothetical protein